MRMSDWSSDVCSSDLLLMTAFGVAGYVLRKMDFPLVPVVLGILLGGLLEINLRRALSISAGDWSVLVSSNLAIGLWIAGALMLVPTVVLEIRRLRGQRGWLPAGVDAYSGSATADRRRGAEGQGGSGR